MKELAILARGMTYMGCPDDIEVWAVSCPRGDKWELVDRVFLLDPVWEINSLEGDNCYGIVDKINKRNVPVYLQDTDPKIPSSVRYPIEAVVDYFGKPIFFSNTICYVIALAIFDGYEKIYFYGVDQQTKEEYGGEKGGVEFWVGMARGKGIEVVIPKGSAVCRNVGGANFYGYRVSNISEINNSNV